MDDLIKDRLYYDFYGDLLTQHQRDVLDLYYDEDLSLAEIAQRLGSSRQAVYDLVRRANKSLNSYESKLHLVAHEISQEKERQRIVLNLKSILANETLSLDSRTSIMDIIHNFEVENDF